MRIKKNKTTEMIDIKDLTVGKFLAILHTFRILKKSLTYVGEDVLLAMERFAAEENL